MHLYQLQTPIVVLKDIRSKINAPPNVHVSVLYSHACVFTSQNTLGNHCNVEHASCLGTVMKDESTIKAHSCTVIEYFVGRHL